MNDLAQGLDEAGADHDQAPILEAVHLRKMFPLSSLNLFGAKQAVHAVEDTSLALYPGRATALVGESGSGKTTGTYASRSV
jgi:ABC-type glutathione transport system ATPase component